MESSYIENKDYQGLDFRVEKLSSGEYELCIFKDCIFSNLDLTGFSFTECEFENCDLSNAFGINISMRDVIFRNCKILGVRFDQCNPFLLSFRSEERRVGKECRSMWCS